MAEVGWVVRKELGKISAARFGFGGYQDVMMGASFTIGGEGWGVGDFWGTWADDPSERAKWTFADQNDEFAKTTRRLVELLKAAKKSDVSQLVGTPVEVTFDGNLLKSWRVLTEVV